LGAHSVSSSGIIFPSCDIRGWDQASEKQQKLGLFVRGSSLGFGFNREALGAKRHAQEEGQEARIRARTLDCTCPQEPGVLRVSWPVGFPWHRPATFRM
jgi:hypothetical protein